MSGAFGEYTGELHVVKTRAVVSTGAVCQVQTVVNLLGDVHAWDGIVTNGGVSFSVFDLKQSPSLLQFSSSFMEDLWAWWSCAGVFTARISNDIMVAVSLPTVIPIFETFVDMYRAVILSDAASFDVCMTDEQLQSYFAPWSVQFWLNLVSSWGPDGVEPDLLPGMPSLAQLIMDEVGAEFQDTDSCPVVCLPEDGCDPDCVLFGGCLLEPMGPGYEVLGYPSEADCLREICGATPDPDAELEEGVPCAGPMVYPSLNLPASCTLAGYSKEPSDGCAMSYDLSWALAGDELAVDMSVAKCNHNAMSLATVSIKCNSPEGGLCNYGRDWCSDDTPCSDPFAECLRIHEYDDSNCTVVGGDPECLAAGFHPNDCGAFVDIETDPTCRQEIPLELSMDDDPISFFMGAEEMCVSGCNNPENATGEYGGRRRMTHNASTRMQSAPPTEPEPETASGQGLRRLQDFYTPTCDLDAATDGTADCPDGCDYTAEVIVEEVIVEDPSCTGTAAPAPAPLQDFDEDLAIIQGGNGFEYMLLDGSLPDDVATDCNSGTPSNCCQTEPILVPQGWTVATRSDFVIENIIAMHPWRTHGVCLIDGTCWYVAGQGSATGTLDRTDWIISSPMGIGPAACHERILLERPTCAATSWENAYQDYNGYRYAVMDGTAKEDSDTSSGCQELIEMPWGWEVAPYSADIRANVVTDPGNTQWQWGSVFLVFADGSYYDTDGDQHLGNSNLAVDVAGTLDLADGDTVQTLAYAPAECNSGWSGKVLIRTVWVAGVAGEIGADFACTTPPALAPAASDSGDFTEGCYPGCATCDALNDVQACSSCSDGAPIFGDDDGDGYGSCSPGECLSDCTCVEKTVAIAIWSGLDPAFAISDPEDSATCAFLGETELEDSFPGESCLAYLTAITTDAGATQACVWTSMEFMPAEPAAEPTSGECEALPGDDPDWNAGYGPCCTYTDTNVGWCASDFACGPCSGSCAGEAGCGGAGPAAAPAPSAPAAAPVLHAGCTCMPPDEPNEENGWGMDTYQICHMYTDGDIFCQQNGCHPLDGCRPQEQWDDVNTKVAPGPLDLEIINFARGLFDLEAFDALPAGIGYCVPASVEVLEDDLNNPMDRVSGDLDTLTFAVNDLRPSVVPNNIGGSPFDVVDMVPPYGSETCGLAVVTQVIVAGSLYMPALPDVSILESALTSQIPEEMVPGGVDFAITSVITIVTNELETTEQGLQAALNQPNCTQACLDEVISTGYLTSSEGGYAAFVQNRLAELYEVERHAVTVELNEDLCTDCAYPSYLYIVTDHRGYGNLVLPRNSQIIESFYVQLDDVHQPVIASNVGYTLTMMQDAMADGSSITAALDDTSATRSVLAAAFGVPAAEVELTNTVSAVQPVTTTFDAAEANAVEAAASVAAPPPPPPLNPPLEHACSSLVGMDYGGNPIGTNGQECGYAPIVEIVADHADWSAPGWYSGSLTIDAAMVSPMQCQARCLLNADCDFFSYEWEYTLNGMYHECYLKTAYLDASGNIDANCMADPYVTWSSQDASWHGESGPGISCPVPGAPSLAEIELMCPAEYAACLADVSHTMEGCPSELSVALSVEDPPSTGSGTYLALNGCISAEMDVLNPDNPCGEELTTCLGSPVCDGLLRADSLEMTACGADRECALLMVCDMAVHHWAGDVPECVTQCRADLTDDHRIGVEDLLLLLSQYGSIC
jgi:hypothetical protein